MSAPIQSLLLTDFGEFLDWNRYMLLGLSMWTLLVAFVVATTNNAQCTSENSFAGMVWIVGLVLLFFTVLAELSTDIKEKKASTKKKEKSIFAKTSHDISWKSIIWRFCSNSLLFYVLIAIGSYNWFPTGSAAAGCFIPWTQQTKDSSLIVSGFLAFVFLLMRVLVFNYETTPQDKRVAEILNKLISPENLNDFDFGKDLSKIEPIIQNFGIFAKRLKRRQAYFNPQTGLFELVANGAFADAATILSEPEYNSTNKETIDLVLQKMKLLSSTLVWLDKTLDEFVSNPIPVNPDHHKLLA